MEQDPNHVKVLKTSTTCIGLWESCIKIEVNNLFICSMGWESWSWIFENAFLMCVVSLCGWFIGTIILKFELRNHGNDFKIWEKQNLTGSCQDV